MKLKRIMTAAQFKMAVRQILNVRLERLRLQQERAERAQAGDVRVSKVWVKKHRRPAVKVSGHWRLVTSERKEKR